MNIFDQVKCRTRWMYECLRSLPRLLQNGKTPRDLANANTAAAIDAVPSQHTWHIGSSVLLFRSLTHTPRHDHPVRPTSQVAELLSKIMNSIKLIATGVMMYYNRLCCMVFTTQWWNSFKGQILLMERCSLSVMRRVLVNKKTMRD